MSSMQYATMQSVITWIYQKSKYVTISHQSLRTLLLKARTMTYPFCAQYRAIWMKMPLSSQSNPDTSFPDMQFRIEDLPDFESIDKVLSYFKQESDMVGFLSCSMVLRTTLTTNELVTLERNMFLQDANGNYGIRMKLTDHAYRFIKLPDDIVELINQYTQQRMDNQASFFLNKKGKAVSSRALQNRLREACLACEVKPFTYNDLRILSQALMLKEGAPLGKVAEHVNVKNVSWFFRYNRVIESLDDSPVDYSHLKIVW